MNMNRFYSANARANKLKKHHLNIEFSPKFNRKNNNEYSIFLYMQKATFVIIKAFNSISPMFRK